MAIFDKTIGFIKGLGGNVSGAWSSGRAAVGNAGRAYSHGMGGTTFGNLLKGSWNPMTDGALIGRNMAIAGAGVGALAGGVAGGRDHRMSGAVTGGLLGAGAGFSGALAHNNWQGVKNMASEVRGAFGPAHGPARRPVSMSDFNV